MNNKIDGRLKVKDTQVYIVFDNVYWLIYAKVENKYSTPCFELLKMSKSKIIILLWLLFH